jgi:hypothetical protein
LHDEDDDMTSNGLIKLATRFRIERKDPFEIKKENQKPKILKTNNKGFATFT